MYGRRAGFTIIELLAVLAIVAIIATISFVAFQNYANYQRYDQAVGGVIGTLNDVRIRARASEGGTAHGVKIFTNSLVVFEGTSYSAASASNEVFEFPVVELAPTLVGGVDEIVFESLTGIPSVTGSIDIVGLQYSDTRTVEISGAGVIQ